MPRWERPSAVDISDLGRLGAEAKSDIAVFIDARRDIETADIWMLCLSALFVYLDGDVYRQPDPLSSQNTLGRTHDIG